MNEAALEAIVADWEPWAQAAPQIIGPLSGGLSNSSVLLQIAEQRYVLRLNGEGLAIDRGQERAAQTIAAQHRLAPALLYQDPGLKFQVSEYVVGRSWTQADINNPLQLSKLAGLLAHIHCLPAIEGRLDIAAKINRYQQQRRYFSAALAQLEPALNIIVEQLYLAPVPCCLCHGDLLAANIVESEGRLWALDWEYAAMSSPHFDLAVVLTGQNFDPNLVTALIEQYQMLRPGSSIASVSLQQWRIAYLYLDCLWYALQGDDAATGEAVEQKVKQLQAMLKH